MLNTYFLVGVLKINPSILNKEHWVRLCSHTSFCNLPLPQRAYSIFPPPLSLILKLSFPRTHLNRLVKKKKNLWWPSSFCCHSLFHPFLREQFMQLFLLLYLLFTLWCAGASGSHLSLSRIIAVPSPVRTVSLCSWSFQSWSCGNVSVCLNLSQSSWCSSVGTVFPLPRDMAPFFLGLLFRWLPQFPLSLASIFLLVS